MSPIGTRSVKVAGVVSGMVLAWLLQPLCVPPFTARATVGIEPGELSDFVHRTGPLLDAASAAYARQKPGDPGFRAAGFRNPSGRQNELEAYVTTRDRDAALAILDDWTARVLEARPGSRLLHAPARDRIARPNLPVVFAGALLGWLLTSRLVNRRRDSAHLPDCAA